MRTFPVLVFALFALTLQAPPLLAQEKKENPWPTKIAGKAVGDWIKELKSGDPGVVENALRTLPAFGEPASKAVPDIVEILNRSGGDVSPRVNAAYVLLLL